MPKIKKVVKTKKVKKKKRHYGFKPEWYVESYKLSRSGLSDKKIAAALGISYMTFYRYKKEDKTLQKALDDGRQGGVKPMESFRDYVFHRLPENLKEIWDEIQACDAEEDSPITHLENYLSEAGLRGRQHLFLYALVHYNFSISDACRAVNIRRSTFNDWMGDYEFAELIKEINQAKKDFFEAALVGAVKNGETSAIIFANKSLNSDRGYGASEKKVKVSVEGSVDHAHTHTISVNDLNLDLEAKMKLLEAYRRNRELQEKKANEQKLPRIAIAEGVR